MSTLILAHLLSYRSVTRLKKLRLQNFLRLASSKNLTTKNPYTIEIDDYAPSKLQLEFNRLALQIDNSVVAKCGKSSVIVTAGIYREKSRTDLSVDYRFRPVALNRFGKTSDQFLKTSAILCSRAADRSIRVCLPEKPGKILRVEVLVQSYDMICDHLLLAINGIHAVLSTMDIPFIGPMGAVRVGRVDGQFVLNPSVKQLRESELDLLLVVDEDEKIVMLEVQSNNVPYTTVSDALDFGAEHGSKVAKNLKLYTTNPFCSYEYNGGLEIDQEFCSKWESQIRTVLSKPGQTKSSRNADLGKIATMISNDTEENAGGILIPIQTTQHSEFNETASTNNNQSAQNLVTMNLSITSQMSLKMGQVIPDQSDGRQCHELRHLDCEVGNSDLHHGSARFQRGETQVVATVVLNEKQLLPDKAVLGNFSAEYGNRFKVEYYFHNFNRKSANYEPREYGFNRRELGHASLAYSALYPLLPPDFPFSIILTSDVTDSGGSSSMATICAGSLALMDAGIQLSEPAAGVALGLSATDPKDPQTFRILNDITGFEDGLGFMDFKVGGTRNGITVCQLDLKIPGVPISFVKRCFFLGQVSIQEIIERMTKLAGIRSARPDLKENAPILKTVKMDMLDSTKILRQMYFHRDILMFRESYGITFTLQPDGIQIYAPSKDILMEAEEDLASIIIQPPELVENSIYEAQIVGKSHSHFKLSINPDMDFIDLPVSQITTKPVASTDACEFDVGDVIKVKYFGKDPVSGKMRFSRRALLVQSEKTVRVKKGQSLKDALFEDS